MGISINDFIQMQARMNHNKLRDPQEPFEPAERETGKSGLQSKIQDWCDAQWPRWKYRHARTDKKTTEEKGVEDFTIFAPNNKTFHIECKAINGKPSKQQLIWKTELAQLGHTVHEIRSLDYFLEVVGSKNQSE